MRKIAWISGLSAFLVFVLAVIAFVLSYSALYAVAVQAGVRMSLAWIWPLVVDFAMIVFSLSIVRNSLLRERTVFAWTLAIVFAAVSTIFNIVHAQSNLLSQAVYALPPVALVLSFEILMSQVRNNVQRQAKADSLGELDRQITDRTKALDSLSDKIQTETETLKTLRQEKREVKKETKTRQVETHQPRQDKVDRQTRVLSMVQEGYGDRQIAEMLNVSLKTIQRDMKELNGKVSEVVLME